MKVGRGGLGFDMDEGEGFGKGGKVVVKEGER